MFVREETIAFIKNCALSVRFLSVQHYPPHYHHGVVELLISIKGNTRIVSGFESVQLHAGEFFTIDQGDIHYIYSDDPDNIVLSVHIDLTPRISESEELKYMLFVFENDKGQETRNDQKARVLDLLMAAGYLFSKGGNLSARHYNDIADSLIDIMREHFSLLDYLIGYNTVSRHTVEVMKRIVVYIMDNYMKSISLSTLADNPHYDKSYLARFMKNLTNFNFGTTLNYFRCSKAEFLLLTTDLSNDEIGYRCGFSDLRLFYNSFRKWWKTTPYRHRQAYRGYMSQPDAYRILGPEEVSEPMKEAYCGYTLENELARVSRRQNEERMKRRPPQASGSSSC